MNPDLILKHARPVPRYTSYPSAPNFSNAVGPETYRSWLGASPAGARLSLYVHIPFCRELCWYCACTTKAVQRYDPIAQYLLSVEQEIANIANLLPNRVKVTQIHWGGGSPSILCPDDIKRLFAVLREKFPADQLDEFAVEIDPRNLPEETIRAFASAGVTRVSIGVQDFDPAVQNAINRAQTLEETARAIGLFRAQGVDSINIDLVYGLPHQGQETLERTIEQVLRSRPDRIAIFGYAHVPERARHQKMIDEASIPDAAQRVRQSQLLRRIVLGAGYKQVGIDHFALRADKLATHPTRRNFQGYTTDDSDAIIGLGASAIGQLPQGYVQNAVPVGEYVRRIAENGLATARGIALSLEDRMRARVIERLMCDFTFSASALEAEFGKAADMVVMEAEAFLEMDQDGLAEPTRDGFRCTERGRVLVRSICTWFDAYWLGDSRHSLAV